MVLIKCLSNGTRVWTEMVSTSGDDIAYGVDFDHSGYVYASGYAFARLHGVLSIALEQCIWLGIPGSLTFF